MNVISAILIIITKLLSKEAAWIYTPISHMWECLSPQKHGVSFIPSFNKYLGNSRRPCNVLGDGNATVENTVLPSWRFQAKEKDKQYQDVVSAGWGDESDEGGLFWDRSVSKLLSPCPPSSANFSSPISKLFDPCSSESWKILPCDSTLRSPVTRDYFSNALTLLYFLLCELPFILFTYFSVASLCLL